MHQWPKELNIFMYRMPFCVII